MSSDNTDIGGRLVRSLQRSLQGGGGAKGVPLNDAQRKKFRTAIQQMISHYEGTQRGLDAVDQEAKRCEDFGDYVPCDPLKLGQCPDEADFRVGGRLHQQEFSKYFEVNGNGKDYTRRRCVPKVLLNSGTIPDTYKKGGDDTMQTRLFKMWKSLGIIRKAFEDANTFNQVLMPRGGADQKRGTIQASQCKKAQTREQCEMLMTSREEGGEYGRRCHFDDSNTCVDATPGLAVYRELTGNDEGTFVYSFEEDDWVRTIGGGATLSAPKGGRRGVFGNTRRQLVAGDIYASLPLAMLRMAAGKEATNRFFDVDTLRAMYDTLVGHAVKGGAADVTDASLRVILQKGDPTSRRTELLTTLATNNMYGASTTTPTWRALESQPNANHLQMTAERKEATKAKFAADAAYMAKWGRATDTSMLYKALLATMLRAYMKNPLQIKKLPMDDQKAIAYNVAQHLSYVRYLPAMVNESGIRPADPTFVLARSAGASALGQGNRSPAFSYDNIDKPRAHNGSTRMEGSSAGNAEGGQEVGYDKNDYKDVVQQLILGDPNDTRAPMTVPDLFDTACEAIDLHMDEVRKVAAKRKVATQEALQLSEMQQDEHNTDRLRTQKTDEERETKGVLDAMFA